MPGDGELLTTDSVSICTATVEVRVLKIGKRQLTLSVFRQLPRADLIDRNCELLGEPWGTVNYFWDGCGHEGGSHLHVVFNRHGRLFRACVGRILSDTIDGALEFIGDEAGLRMCGTKEWNGMFGYWYVAPTTEQDRRRALEVKQAWNKVYDQLARLEQLFIAV
jgi:hypothetical protein